MRFWYSSDGFWLYLILIWFWWLLFLFIRWFSHHWAIYCLFFLLRCFVCEAANPRSHAHFDKRASNRVLTLPDYIRGSAPLIYKAKNMFVAKHVFCVFKFGPNVMYFALGTRSKCNSCSNLTSCESNVACIYSIYGSSHALILMRGKNGVCDLLWIQISTKK